MKQITSINNFFLFFYARFNKITKYRVFKLSYFEKSPSKINLLWLEEETVLYASFYAVNMVKMVQNRMSQVWNQIELFKWFIQVSLWLLPCEFRCKCVWIQIEVSVYIDLDITLVKWSIYIAWCMLMRYNCI